MYAAILAVAFIIHGGVVWVAIKVASLVSGIGRVFVLGAFAIIMARLIIYDIVIIREAIESARYWGGEND
jgi:hypothetical protein